MVLNGISKKLVGNSCIGSPVEKEINFISWYVEGNLIVLKVIYPSLSTCYVLKGLSICLFFNVGYVGPVHVVTNELNGRIFVPLG